MRAFWLCYCYYLPVAFAGLLAMAKKLTIANKIALFAIIKGSCYNVTTIGECEVGGGAL